MNRTIQPFIRWLYTSWLPAIAIAGLSTTTQAQLPPAQLTPNSSVAASPCQPPQPNEFLLLVVTRTPASQAQVNQLLPPNTSIVTCRYLDDTVTRVGGFRTVERANAWARYLSETTGLAAFVARPAEAPATATTLGIPQTTPSATVNRPAATKPTASGYNPTPLGPGYAVLVDYANQPELAAKLQQALGKEIGLVSYGQSPFLLALYTNDSNAANAALQALSDRGFWATLVDSRRVVLLRQPVVLPRSVSQQ
ncbi:MAG: hypothetical protein NW220_20585 [Leptolyngbyaceae cyanobacterium bins.349]|nr:hypothetical protein [Leptolyngbyaceae cyanobacterium bins.349]